MCERGGGGERGEVIGKGGGDRERGRGERGRGGGCVREGEGGGDRGGGVIGKGV